MKKFIAIVFTIILFSFCTYIENHYTKPECEIVKIDNEIVYVVDRLGNKLSFIDTEHKYKIGETVNLRMSVHGTPDDSADDEIVKVIMR